jgi:hypothetical protein
MIKSLVKAKGLFWAPSGRLSELPRTTAVAEDCLLTGLCEGPLTRRLTLKLGEAAVITDPKTSLARPFSKESMKP